MRSTVSLLFVLFCATAPLMAEEKALDLTPVRQWIERQSKIKTLEVSFKQLRFLKTVKKPLEAQGTLRYAAPGSIRWEVGNPPKNIAVVKVGGDLTIIDKEKNEAQVITRAELQERADGQGVAFLESGFPRSFEAFQKTFKVSSVEKVDSYHKVEAKMVGGEKGILTKLVFFIHDGSWLLGGIHFHFRDGSRVESTFGKVTENKEIKESEFTLDLKGYTIKKEE